MTILEIIEYWENSHPYRDIQEDKPYTNLVRYIDAKKIIDISSKMNFLEGVDKDSILLLLANINLYLYSQRSKNNYSKVKRPDKVLSPFIKKIDDLITFLDNTHFDDDVNNLKLLRSKLSNKEELQRVQFVHPQQPMNKKVIKNILDAIIKNNNINVPSMELKSFIDCI